MEAVVSFCCSACFFRHHSKTAFSMSVKFDLRSRLQFGALLSSKKALFISLAHFTQVAKVPWEIFRSRHTSRRVFECVSKSSRAAYLTAKLTHFRLDLPSGAIGLGNMPSSANNTSSGIATKDRIYINVNIL